MRSNYQSIVRKILKEFYFMLPLDHTVDIEIDV